MGRDARGRAQRRALALLALAVLALALPPLAPPGAMATHTDDAPGSGTWAANGSSFRDWVSLSSDDPSADAQDWYRINLTAGPTEVDVLRIEVNMTLGGNQDMYFVWASIHDPDGALLQEVKTASYTKKAATFACHRTGVHLVRVYTYSRYQCNYLLTFDVSTAANTSDGDDMLSQARFLEPPASAQGHVNGVWDTFDHYAVNLTRGALSYELLEVRLYPEVERPSQDLDLFLIVINATGVPHEVASSLSNGSTEVTFYSAEAIDQTVYIRVHAYGGITNYTVVVRTYDVPDDGNNKILDAEEVAQNASREDALNLTDPRDYFKVNLTGGDLLTATVLAHGYDAVLRKPNFDLYILDYSGRIVNWSFQYDPLERAAFEVPLGQPPAWHYVLVTYHDRTPLDGVPAWGNYTLNLTVDHAPAVIVPLPLEMEEDVAFGIELADLLSDADGPLGAVMVARTVNVSADVDGGRLDITAPDDFWGAGEVVLRVATGPRHVLLPMPVEVSPVPDAPRLRSPLPPLDLLEDTTSEVNLSLVFRDPDGDPLTYSLVVPTGSALGASSIGGPTLTVVPDPDFNGESSLLVTATDPGGLSLTQMLTFTVAPVEDPPRVLVADANVTAPEDTRGIEVDLSALFDDPDGDPLVFEPTGGEHLTYIVLGDLLVVDPEVDFSGTDAILVTAREQSGAYVSTTVRFVITPVNDAPRVTFQDPQGDVLLVEGSSTVLTVSAQDPEGSALTYAWYVDGVLAGETLPRLELVANYSSQGEHLASVAISDGELVSWANWTVRVENVNRPPVVEVLRPEDGSTFEEGANVVMEATATDPDGEAPRVVWTVDGEVVGEGMVFTTSKLKAGKHRLVVTATDPHNATATAEVGLEVEEAGGIPGPTAALMVVGVAVAAAIAALMVPRRRAPPPMSLPTPPPPTPLATGR
jgi:hypothetical protein